MGGGGRRDFVGGRKVSVVFERDGLHVPGGVVGRDAVEGGLGFVVHGCGVQM